MNCAEQWRVIEEFPKYEISNKGRVRNRERKKLLTPYGNNNRTGHLKVGLYNGSRSSRKRFWVHILVALAFIGAAPEDLSNPVICHADGDPTNNDVENLRWGTRLENWYDFVMHTVAEEELPF